MMKEKLGIQPSPDGYGICWELEDEDGFELGLFLGEEPEEEQDEEHAFVTAYTRRADDTYTGDAGRLLWDTVGDAKAALKIANQARERFRRERSEPPPAWAQEALDAGWLPPKEWPK